MLRVWMAALLLAPQEPPRGPALTAKEFEAYPKMISPLPGEYAWRDEIPWLTRLGEAREKAAAEDKPILILGSQNAFPLGRTSTGSNSATRTVRSSTTRSARGA